MAPVQRRAKRLVAIDGHPPSAGEQREAIVEARGDLLQSQRGDARRGKLDSKRDSIQAPANRDDDRKTFRVRRKVRQQRLGRAIRAIRDAEEALEPQLRVHVGVDVAETLASPQSTTRVSPCLPTTTLAGLMSRCSTPRPCAYSIALQTSTNRRKSWRRSNVRRPGSCFSPVSE